MASILKCDTIQKPDGSTPTAADLGIDVAGSVVQVQTLPFTTDVYASSSSWLSLGSISFTPKYADSKIVLQLIGGKCNGGAGTVIYYGIFRDGAELNTSTIWFGSSSFDASPQAAEVDYPNTTSAVTYELKWFSSGTVRPFHFTAGMTPYLVITEIAQ